MKKHERGQVKHYRYVALRNLCNLRNLGTSFSVAAEGSPVEWRFAGFSFRPQESNLILLSTTPEGGLIYAKCVGSFLQRFRSHQNSPNVLFFNLGQGYSISEPEPGFSFSHFVRQVFQSDSIGFAEYGRPLCYVAQFPHVSRPIVFPEGEQSFIRESLKYPMILATEERKKPVRLIA